MKLKLSKAELKRLAEIVLMLERDAYISLERLPARWTEAAAFRPGHGYDERG